MVNILKLPESALCYALGHFGMNHLSSGYSALEAAVVHKETKDPKIAQHIHTIQTAFNIVNAGWLLWATYRLIEEASPFHFISLLKYSSVATFGAFATIQLVNKYFQPNNPENHPNASWELPTNQKIAQYLYISQIIVNITRAYFASSHLQLGITIFSQLYSLLQISQLKWLKFTSTFQPNRGGIISKIKVSYRALLLPYVVYKGNPEWEAQAEDCPICREPPESYFCTRHGYCDDHMIGWISQTIENLVTSNHFQLRYHQPKYIASIPENNLPSCSWCTVGKSPPMHAYLDVDITDYQNNQFTADVKITNRKPSPPLFSEQLINTAIDAAQATYSAFQTLLTCVQQNHPEFADTIFTMQKVLMIADAVALIENYKQLYNQMKKRYAEEDRPTWKLCLIVAALAALVVLALHQFLKPTIDLKKLLENAVSLSSEDAAMVDVSWDSPWIQKFSQWIYVQRIASHLALGLLSPKRYLNFFNAACQTASLLNISKLPWIHMVKKFSDARVKSYSASAYFLLPHHAVDAPSHCADATSHLQSALKTTYNYMANLFKNSKWNYYWLITRQNGIEIGRRLVCDITLQKSSLQACECGSTPLVDSLSASIQGVSTTHLI